MGLYVLVLVKVLSFYKNDERYFSVLGRAVGVSGVRG